MPSDLETRIAQMGDEELRELGAQYDTLTEEAQDLVRAEYARRSIDAPMIDDRPAAQSQPVRTIRQYSHQVEALFARSVLESAGIPCYLRDENTIRTQWLWSNLIGGIRLQVAEQDVESAEAVLAEPIPASIAVEGEPDFAQPACPNCGALEIRSQDFNTKLGAASILLLGFPLQTPGTYVTWLCDKCGCKWSDSDGHDE